MIHHYSHIFVWRNFCVITRYLQRRLVLLARYSCVVIISKKAVVLFINFNCTCSHAVGTPSLSFCLVQVRAAYSLARTPIIFLYNKIGIMGICSPLQECDRIIVSVKLISSKNQRPTARVLFLKSWILKCYSVLHYTG